MLLDFKSARVIFNKPGPGGQTRHFVIAFPKNKFFISILDSVSVAGSLQKHLLG